MRHQTILESSQAGTTSRFASTVTTSGSGLIVALEPRSITLTTSYELAAAELAAAELAAAAC